MGVVSHIDWKLPNDMMLDVGGVEGERGVEGDGVEGER